VRLQIDLLDATSGAELWGDHYERKLADLLAVQDQISREVSQRLRALSEKVVAQPSAVSFQPVTDRAENSQPTPYGIAH
jgi:hypothetical protein